MKTFPKNLIALCFLALILTSHAGPAFSAPASNVAATDGLWGGWVRITWDSAYTKGFHNVERSVSAGGTYTNIHRIAIDGSTTSYFFNDNTAVTNTKYYYRIKTCLDITCETSIYDVGWRGYLNAVNKINATDNTLSDYTQVTWSSVTGTDFYEVYRSSTVDGAKILAGTSTTIFFFDTEVTPAAGFYYHVRACYDNGTKRCSVFYLYDEGRRAWPVVENVVASDGGYAGFVRVRWDAVSGASGYKVYYSTNGGSTYLGNQTVTGVNSYDYYLPLIGFEYTFAVTPCFDTACGSTKSKADIGWLDLPTPTGVQASDGNTWTLVQWNEAHTDAWYYVFRDSANNPVGKTLAGKSGTAENFADNFANGGLMGTLYNYWVVACPHTATSATDPGCSGYSKPESGYYLPFAVKNLAASDGTSPDHILVTWDAIDGATSYAVERTDNIFDPFPVWTGPYTSATNQYQDGSALEGVKYWYVARACGADYCADPSGNDSGYLQGICYDLTLKTVGNGEITPNPKNSLGCPAGQYIKGEKIELTAAPDPDWDFESWNGTDDDGSISGVNYLTMPANAHTVTATFSIGCENLYLQTTGNGTLTADPLSSADCGKGTYVKGEVITLTATPDSTWFLANWFGTDDNSSTSLKNTYTMTDQSTTVTAKFARECEVLSLKTVGNGSLDTYPEFSEGCPSGSFADGELVEIHASADFGWEVKGWSGTDDDSNTTNVNQYKMTASAHTVTVTFILDCNELNLSWDNDGTVSASPLSSDGCPTGTYIPGAVINLKATPGEGFRLAEWRNTDDDSSSALTNTCTMDLSNTLNVGAVFKPDTNTVFSSGFEGQDR